MANGLFNLKQVMQGIQQNAWINQAPPAVEYLVVAGGGGAGCGTGSSSNGGGGGGAGGLLAGISPVPNGQTLLVTVGGGGAGGASNSSGVNGSNSVFGPITTLGGGYGTASRTGNAGSGGSGGGSGELNTTSGGFAGQGTKGQGNAGGTGLSYPCGGGGGAGTVGSASATGSTSAPGGRGGSGVTSVINGTATAYAGGGGGCSYNGGGSTAGTGGVGGGGNANVSGSGTSGTTNTGGGGGGSGNSGSSGGSGGSGIVIVSYPDVYAAPTATTGSPTVSTSGSGSIYYPNAGGTGAGTGATFIQFSNTTALQTGTTATYEAWIYPTAFTTNHRIMSQQGSNSGIEIYYDSSGNVNVGYTSGGAYASVSSSPLSLNTWYHIAVVFTSGTMTVYFNGVNKTLTGTTVGYNFTSTNPLFVGSYSNGNQYGVIGYLSNVRIVKGVAVYTGNFTTPTSPLQAIQSAGTNISAITGTQTSLLLNSVSGAFTADGSTYGYTPAAASTGSAAPTWNALSPFTVTGYKNRVYTWTTSGSITF